MKSNESPKIPTNAERVQHCLTDADDCLATIANDADESGKPKIAENARVIGEILRRMAADNYDTYED